MEVLLARLEAESAIRRLVGRYCDAVGRRDADAAAELFAPDAQVAIADFPPLSGAHAIRAGLRQTFAAHAFLRQQCDVNLIEVAGDAARAQLGVFEASQRTGDARLSLIFGCYADRYVRLAQGWRFLSRRYTLQYRCLADVAKSQLAGELPAAFADDPFPPE